MKKPAKLLPAKLPTNRSVLSDLAYVALNIGLAATLLLVVLAVKSPAPAFVLVLLGKWRILAVRPRFWFKNIQSNMVDIIVGLSTVVLLYASTGAVIVQVALAVLYAAWLLFIKPKSKQKYVVFQAGVATFLGVTTLAMISYSWPATAVVLVMWVIGYTSARHILSHYHEDDRTLLAMVWGLIVAEIGWLTYHWNFAYNLPGLAGIGLSQAALITVVIGFMVQQVYDAYHHSDGGAITFRDVSLPVFFSIGLVLCILIAFNKLGSILT